MSAWQKVKNKERQVSEVTEMFTTKPFYSPRPWGYEQWTLSTHRAGQSLVLPEKVSLLDYLGKPLPILIKVIKADENLSVQVHPDDEYAMIHENDKGKTECWFILDCKKDAKLIAGIEPGLTREKMAEILKEGKLADVVEYIDIQPGDMIFIPAGTVHAIMGGIKLFEIQESSDSTYRMYDWGRDRPMHIKKSLDVIDYSCTNGAGKIENFTKLETPFFNVEKVDCSGRVSFAGTDRFQTLNVCHGTGTITTNNQTLNLRPDETIYIPEGTDYSIEGELEVLRTY